MDSHSTESILQMIRTLLQVRIAGHGHYKVEMAVHELLALAGNHLLYTFYVFDRCLVARVGNARVPVLLLVQQRKFTLLVGKEDDLVIDHCIGIRNAVNGRDKIHGHFRVVHFYIGIGSDHRRQRDAVHVHETVHLAALVTHRDALVVRLEVRHRDNTVLEVHGEIPVHVIACLGFVQETRLHAAVPQLVLYLADLDKEITPFLVVEREKAAFPGFLRDGQVTHAVRVRPSLEIPEIRFRKELLLPGILVDKTLPHEDVLLVNGITFSQGQGKGGEQMREIVVAVYVRRILLYRILDLQHGGIFARLGVQDTHAFRVFHREIDVLEDTLALASGTERMDGYGHTRA